MLALNPPFATVRDWSIRLLSLIGGLIAVLGGQLASSGFAAPPTEALHRFEFERIEMAMPFKIIVYVADEAVANQAAEATFARIHELNAIFSDYDPDSECSRLSRGAPHEKPVVVSPDMLKVLSFAQKLSDESGGAFDLTVGPVVRLWRSARRNRELPDQKQLKEALQAVGYNNIRLDERAGTVQLIKANLRLDFGGIACGYAVDEGLKVLKQHGISRAMIDGSGDIGVLDPPPGKPGWRIGVGKLEQPGEVARFVLLANAALTTSGDTFQFVELGGVRYSHLVDPATGVGLTDHSSVTVIAPDCITADSYTKPIAVRGASEGFKLIEKTPGTAALVMRKPGGTIEFTQSNRWHHFEEK